MIAATLFLASPALAADTFVNQATGNDANLCTTAAQPCATIAAGITKSGPGDTVTVAEGTYVEPQLVTTGRSLAASGSAASTIITPASTLTALLVTTGAASSVEGFTIRCPDCTVDQVDVNAPGTIRGNVFDGDASGTMALGDLAVRFGSGAVTLDQNVFTDPDPTDTQTAITLNSADQPTISDNQITGFFNAIEIDRAGAGTMIRGNTISQTHNSGSGGAAISGSPAGNNPATDNVAPTIVGNTIHNPINVGGLNPVPSGITFSGDGNAAAPTFGATLRRNRVIGHNPAVRAGNTDGAVTLESDLLVGAPDGLSAFENGAGSDLGNVTATNVTVSGGARAVVLQHTHLTLDSSIVDASIMDAGSGVADTATCAITNSRGLSGANPPTGNGCDGTDFSTAADPMFVSAGTGDYHLAAGSPMLDRGNPADPGGGAADFDGNSRAIASRCGWTVRRDIGADERTGCTAAEAQIDSGPSEGAVTKSSSATFGFSGPPPSFQCSLDGAGFSACTSPAQFAALADGNHTLAIRGSDMFGNVDLSPTTRTWRIDTTAPETAIDSGPADGAVTQERSASYGFSSEPGASFECSVDGGAFAACTSPASLSELSDGAHSFAVRATDSAGNTDQSPAQRGLRVERPAPPGIDTEPPETTVRKAKVKDDDVTLRFGSDEPGSSFRCKLDKKKLKPCASPKTYRNLDEGKHRFFVIATDPAGNADPTAAKSKFEIEG